ncbi:mannose-6-phosphate isomerase [unidentified eubacterium SCB49]|nr:mannose-6-phosphate isomerase [unidentified eubacterium SCB49]
MHNPSLYPLQFTPILKEKIWGGAKLNTIFNKGGVGKLGESWELSGVKDNISIVTNGALKGKSLADLIKTHGSDLLGEKVLKRFGGHFPLLFKFIDASENLSLQLHPDDALAKARHDSFGKTEMWYILHTDEDAKLFIGFKKGVDQSIYAQHISENKLLDIIDSETVKEGDAFFITPGLIHAIGAGVVLAEIQQTSDITYRVYDWDRPDLDGKMRTLHTKEAEAAIKFDTATAKLSYNKKAEEITPICESPYFKTSKINCNGTLDIDYSGFDSFKVYMCVGGKAIVKTEQSENELKKGETLLIPACIEQVTISSENGEILEVYIP